jgi:hypothetical protein
MTVVLTDNLMHIPNARACMFGDFRCCSWLDQSVVDNPPFCCLLKSLAVRIFSLTSAAVKWGELD